MLVAAKGCVVWWSGATETVPRGESLDIQEKQHQPPKKQTKSTKKPWTELRCFSASKDKGKVLRQCLGVWRDRPANGQTDVHWDAGKVEGEAAKVSKHPRTWFLSWFLPWICLKDLENKSMLQKQSPQRCLSKAQNEHLQESKTRLLLTLIFSPNNVALVTQTYTHIHMNLWIPWNTLCSYHFIPLLKNEISMNSAPNTKTKKLILSPSVSLPKKGLHLFGFSRKTNPHKKVYWSVNHWGIENKLETAAFFTGFQSRLSTHRKISAKGHRLTVGDEQKPKVLETRGALFEAKQRWCFSLCSLKSPKKHGIWIFLNINVGV